MKELEVALEEKYNSHKENKRIIFWLKSQIVFEKVFSQEGIKPEVGYALLLAMVLHKQCEPPTLVGILRHFFGSAQETADFLYKAKDIGLIYWNGCKFIVRFDIPEDIQAEIACYQYPLPLVIEPKELIDNKSCGYLTIKNESVICKDNYTEDDVCLDVINIQNRIKFRLNKQVASLTKNEWANLNHRKDGESEIKYQERVRAFNKYDAHARSLVNILANYPLYLTNKVDKRGRLYSQGYFINPQGTDWNKACLEFEEEEVCE